MIHKNTIPSASPQNAVKCGKQVKGGTNFFAAAMMKPPGTITQDERKKSLHDIYTPTFSPYNGLLRR